MDLKDLVSRRTFMEALAAALTTLGIPSGALARQEQAAQTGDIQTLPDYDSMAKLASNENPYGPSPAVLKAMQDAAKYAHRYGYPDPGIVEAIAEFHEVIPENI